MWIDDSQTGLQWASYAGYDRPHDVHSVQFESGLFKAYVGWPSPCQLGLAKQQADLLEYLEVKGVDNDSWWAALEDANQTQRSIGLRLIRRCVRLRNQFDPDTYWLANYFSLFASGCILALLAAPLTWIAIAWKFHGTSRQYADDSMCLTYNLTLPSDAYAVHDPCLTYNTTLPSMMYPIGVKAIIWWPVFTAWVLLCGVLVSPAVASRMLGRPVWYDGTYRLVESSVSPREFTYRDRRFPTYRNQHGALLIRRIERNTSRSGARSIETSSWHFCSGYNVNTAFSKWNSLFRKTWWISSE